MLALLRKFANTLFGKLLVGLLMIGMAGFGISNVITSLGSTTVAWVGSKEISARDFQRTYNDQLNRIAQQTGRMPSTQEALARGVPTGVLQRLASDAAMGKFSADLGLGASETRMSDMVKNDPTFAGTLGAYDARTFSQVLARSGFTENEYFAVQVDAARRQQLAAGLFAGTAAPQTALDILTHFTDDTRTVDYITLNREGIDSVPQPTEDDLAAYLKEHQTEFRTKEARTVDLLVLTPDTLAAKFAPTEDEIAAEYERTKDTRVRVEKRTIRQIALTTPELEKAFVDGQAAGTPLSDLLAANQVAFEDLGTLAKSEINDSTLADAAFGLAQDGYAVIEGIGSKRAITVSGIQAGGQITLAEARDEIAKQLAVKSARDSYGDVLDQIEELRAGSKPLTDVSERVGLKLFSLSITEGGPELVGIETLAEGERTRIADAVFNSELGQLDPSVSMGSSRNAWFDLKSVEPARDQTLSEVRDLVAKDWSDMKTDEALKAEVDTVLAALKAGKTFEEAVGLVGQLPQLSGPIKRTGDGTPLFNADVAAAIFAGGPDHYGQAINGDNDQVLFKVSDVAEADTTPAEAARTYLQNGIRDALYADFTAGVLKDSGLRTNQQLLAQVLSLDTAQ